MKYCLIPVQEYVGCLRFESDPEQRNAGMRYPADPVLQISRRSTMGNQRSNSESRKRHLPSDLDSGEEELLEAFDQWVHTAHPNPTREGCPEHSVLTSLALGNSRVEDVSVL